MQLVSSLNCLCANDGYVKLIVTADVRVVSNKTAETYVHTYIHT